MNYVKRMKIAAILLITILLPYAAHAQSYAQQVWDQLQAQYVSVSENGEYELINYIVGTLDDGTTDTWNFPFNVNVSYVITAACDNDCSDIDVTIKDNYGNILQEDTRTDDQPYVEFSPSASGIYQIEVNMYSCSENPCYFGFGVFQK